MQWLFTLLLFAALFYVMMRFGCGANMIHGNHGGHEGNEEHTTRNIGSKDPVCGMEVSPTEGYSRMFEGKEYRFCSRKCLDQFDADPKRYVSTKGVV